MRSAVHLVAIDLDGTLLRPDGTISDRTRKALRVVQEAGVTIVVATARPPRVVQVLAPKLGVEAPVICANGALVYDPRTCEILDHHPLSSVVARKLVCGLREQAKGVVFACEIGLQFAREGTYEPATWLAEFPPAIITHDLLEILSKPVTKLIAQHPSFPVDNLAELARAIEPNGAEVTQSGGPFVEMLAKGISKGATLAIMCARRGISPSEVLAFGDMPNDLDMLKWAGRSCAVFNAHPLIIAAADDVTASNADDGVAIVLERLVRGEAQGPEPLAGGW